MEGDAGTRQLNPTDAEDAPDQSVAVPEEKTADPNNQTNQDDTATEAIEGDDRRPSRLGRGWLVGICATLLTLALAGAVGGFLALRDHDHSQAVERDDAAALQAAKDCVTATHAPDAAAMAESQTKIIECSTGDFGAQAALYAGMLVEAYKAANVKVQVSDLRAAVERHNNDGSVDVLVAVRTQVTNSEAANQEQGYRLRVTMAPDAREFKIAKIEQVAS
jgi:Mce-associated membrane protein